ncbi:MAG TPA: 30S ribosome-binding factor RbfA [Chloroflexi bacterium]|nr:30S ribosome-binding factor RbfA [Chloroflexota bacterium]
MGKKYRGRAADLIQMHLTDLLQTQVNDPRLSMVTITGVEVTPDTRRADVYITALGGPDVKEEVLDGLQSAAGFLRRELGHRIRLRNTPELVFHWDESFEHGERIDLLLEQIKDDLGGEPEGE